MLTNTIKNYADYFGWAVESIENNSAERNMVVTLTGYPKHECGPFTVDENVFERDINNRMNGKELETTLMRRMINTMHGAYSNNVNFKGLITPKIKNLIFNPPATIVFWTDGTKTVVKCQNHEEFDPEKGLAMAFFKKMHGNKGRYFEEIKKWTEGYINSNGVEVTLNFKDWSEASSILGKIESLRKENDGSWQSN